MAAYYEIKLRPEGTVIEFYGSEGNQYLLEDGTFLRMNATPAWCHACQRFTEGECVEPLSEIDQQLADLKNRDSRLYQFAQRSDAGPGLRLQLIAETGKRRKWRATRTATPKCLRCGTTDILVLPLGEEIASPSSSGTLILELAGFASVAFSDGLFSAEGDRLGPAPAEKASK